MKTIALVLALTAFLTVLMFPSSVLAEKRSQSGIAAYPSFTDQKVPVNQSTSAVNTGKSIDRVRVTLGKVLTFLGWSMLEAGIADSQDAEPDRPLYLQHPPGYRPPSEHRLDADDDGAGPIMP